MPKHEFGIMQNAPERQRRFDCYEPQNYHCITVDDDLIMPILAELASVDFCWHTLQNPRKGLAYWGITLIPPQSMPELLKILSAQNKKEYMPLIDLINTAKNTGSYIIHFGI